MQQRRFYMVAPILVTPFLTMLFWALGGGQGTTANIVENKNAGLNLELPDAQFDNEKNEWNKLILYQQAQRDSMMFYQQKRNDPYFMLPVLGHGSDTMKQPGNINSSLGQKDYSLEQTERTVNRKLDELYKNLNPPPEDIMKHRPDVRTTEGSPQVSSDVQQLENMMNMMRESSGSEEEMKEIQSVLDKVIAIQHPERINTKQQAQANMQATQVFTVKANREQAVGLMTTPRKGDDSLSVAPAQSNVFYGLEDVYASKPNSEAIQAEVYDDQTLVNGSVVKLKLSNDITINGILIPKDHFLYGVCTLNGERLMIEIASIRNANTIIPVSLSVFDLDGLQGVYIPGALARTVAKQSSNDAVSELQLNTMNPSLGVQAASAGIETAKSFLSKKTKLIKVMVKSGYRVLLKDLKN